MSLTKVINRYECHGCKEAHSTENVVAYCAFCFEKMRMLAIKQQKKNKP